MVVADGLTVIEELVGPVDQLYVYTPPPPGPPPVVTDILIGAPPMQVFCVPGLIPALGEANT